MVRKIGVMVILAITLAASIYAQTADRAFSAAIREAKSYVNGCGPEGAPQWAVSGLNYISGNYGACNQHDIDYMTLGMSKSEADNKLFSALHLSSWTAVPAVASVFWGAVRTGGDSAYNNAQRQAKQEFKRIHHGNDWNSGYGKWNPLMGHIKMSFPQCTSSCSYY